MEPWRRLGRSVGLALLLAALWPAGASGVPAPRECSALEPGPRGSCPAAACRTTGGRTVSFAACASCAKGRLMCIPSRPCQLHCTQCKQGFKLYPIDSYQSECLRPERLQCARFDADQAGAAYGLKGPCLACGKGHVPVYATNYGSYEWADGHFSAKRVCRTCTQLGCPLRCKPLAGCTTCPPGSVRLATGPPLGARKWIGENSFYNVGLRAPVLPTVCLTVKSLGCAPGKAQNGLGCTACPAGKKLGLIRPEHIAGSRFIQLRPLGKACT